MEVVRRSASATRLGHSDRNNDDNDHHPKPHNSAPGADHPHLPTPPAARRKSLWDGMGLFIQHTFEPIWHRHWHEDTARMLANATLDRIYSMDQAKRAHAGRIETLSNTHKVEIDTRIAVRDRLKSDLWVASGLLRILTAKLTKHDPSSEDAHFYREFRPQLDRFLKATSGGSIGAPTDDQMCSYSDRYNIETMLDSWQRITWRDKSALLGFVTHNR